MLTGNQNNKQRKVNKTKTVNIKGKYYSFLRNIFIPKPKKNEKKITNNNKVYIIIYYLNR